MSEPARICVLGDGGWGTALALVAHRNGHEVRLWGYDPAYVAQMARDRRNPRYLPGVELPGALVVTSDAAAASRGAELLVSAIPTQFLRTTTIALAPRLPARTPVLSVTKGLENGTLLRPTEVLRETLGDRPAAVLSGPSHAEEVARSGPTSVVVASSYAELARLVQDAFGNDRLRIYAGDDVIGVELAAAVKNVIAIAAGVGDGLGLGDNAKAALLTRGIAEIARLGRAMGARDETFAGLAGIGDLITTCVSRHGRNRGVGERIGRGERIEDVTASMLQVAEGVRTAQSVVELARREGVEMPIAEQVHKMLFLGQTPAAAVAELMARAQRPERDSAP